MSDRRWELVLIADEDWSVVEEAMRRAAVALAMELGQREAISWEVSCFNPHGDCFDEWAHKEGEEP